MKEKLDTKLVAKTKAFFLRQRNRQSRSKKYRFWN